MTVRSAILLVGVGVLGVGVLGVGVLAAAPASATSCVGWPDDVARQAAAGRLPAIPGTARGSVPFTDSFDYALIGTVRSVDEHGLIRRYATVDVDVDAALYLRSVPATVRLSMSDTGAMLGYPFEPGRRYFIPVTAGGRAGLPDPDLRNYVMLCDPVSAVSAADAAELLGVAREASVPVARPGEGQPPRGGAGEAGNDPGPWSAIGAWSVIAVGAAAAIRLAAARTLR